MQNGNRMSDLDPSVAIRLSSGLSLLAITSAIFGMFGNPSWNWWVWNADALGQFSLANDLATGGRFTDWDLGNASYVVPDLAFAFIARLFLPSIPAMVTFNAVLQIGLLWCVLWRLGRAANHHRPVFFSLLSVGVLMGLATTVGEPFALLLSSAHHVGALLGGLLLTAEVLHHRDHSLTSMIGIALITATFSLSDDLFIVAYAGPISVLVVLVGRRPYRRALTASGTILVSAGVGKGISSLLIGSPIATSPDLGLSSMRSRMMELIDVIVFSDSRLPLVGLASGIATVLAIGVTIRSATSRTQEDVSENPHRPFALLLGLSSLSTITPILLGAVNPVAERYVLQIFILPVITISSWLAQNVSWKRLSLVMVLLSLTPFSAVSAASQTVEPWHPWNSQIDCVEAALDSIGATHVISQYWDTHLFSLHSNEDRYFAQFLANAQPYVQVTSKDWYSDDGWYDAALLSSYAGPIHTFTSDQFVTERGNQVSIAQCGPWAVLSAPNDSVRFRTS
jgi:hypothetical protein